MITDLLFLGDLDEGLAGVDLLADETDDLGGRRLKHLGAGAVDLKAGILLNDLGRQMVQAFQSAK